MTKEEFKENYCTQSSIPLADFDKDMVVLPCHCGDELCNGWAAVSNNALSIKAHNDLY